MRWTVAAERHGHMSRTAADLSILNDLIQTWEARSAPCHFLSHDGADLFVRLMCSASLPVSVTITEHVRGQGGLKRLLFVMFL